MKKNAKTYIMVQAQVSQLCHVVQELRDATTELTVVHIQRLDINKLRPSLWDYSHNATVFEQLYCL